MSAATLMRWALASVACLTTATAGAAGFEAPVHNLPPSVQKHVDLAYMILNGDVSDGLLNTFFFNIFPRPGGGRPLPGPPAGGAQAGGPQGGGPGGMPRYPVMPATRVFDQLYYLGLDWVSAWALDTSDGIILIDALGSADEAQKYIEGGLRSLKLDPARIKYILVTHGHDDHFGGAKYLQEKYQARVLMSAADWDFAAKEAAVRPNAGLPAKDMIVSDGQELTLGKSTIHMYLSPGHTPAPVSTIFSVTDHGRPHIVSFFGGMGIQFIDKDPMKGGFATMRQSLMRFAKLSMDAGADVILANHPFDDGSYAKVKQFRGSSLKGPNPWVATKETVLRFYASAIEAIHGVEAFYELNPEVRPQ
jgi:metallo-beta-lactamase class B